MTWSRTEQFNRPFECKAVRLPAFVAGTITRVATRSVAMCRLTQPAYDHTGREGPPSG